VMRARVRGGLGQPQGYTAPEIRLEGDER
jgi:hypothetical protein